MLKLLDSRASSGSTRPSDTAQNPPPRKHRSLTLVLGGILLGAVLLAATGILSRQRSEAKLAQWTGAQAIPSVAVVQPPSFRYSSIDF